MYVYIHIYIYTYIYIYIFLKKTYIYIYIVYYNYIRTWHMRDVAASSPQQGTASAVGGMGFLSASALSTDAG